jgi:hypothetical protein
MKHNHPTPGWKGTVIPAARGGPEKYDDTAWPTRDGTELRIPVGLTNAVRSKDAVPDSIGTGRFKKGATAADLSACGAPDNVNRAGKSPPGDIHIPVCRTGRRDGTTNRARDGTEYSWQPALWNLTKEEIPLGLEVGNWQKGESMARRIPEGLHVYRISNPAGLHVYRKESRRADTTPAGVEQQSALHYFYKHLMPAWSADRPLASGLVVYIAVGFNQRNKGTYTEAGLQPHSTSMRLKPEELLCSSVNRQLKQTAMKEKQMPMDNLYGSPNLQGFGNLEGLTSRNKGREPACHPPGKVCRSGTRPEAASVRMDIMDRIRDGTKPGPANSTEGIPIRGDSPIELHIRVGTVERTRDGTEMHKRTGTEMHNHYGTGLGSRNGATRQPVHLPEWERYGGGSRKSGDGSWKENVKYRITNIEYLILTLSGLSTLFPILPGQAGLWK